MKRILLALAAVLLTACATAPEPRSAKMQYANDGGVLFRVLPNVQSASMFFKNWQAISVVRLAGPGEKEQRFSVSPTTDGTTRSAVYAGTLPPGRYRFDAFSSQQCGYMCVSSSITMSEKFSRFTVQSGRLTDLGVLIQLRGSAAGDVLIAHTRQPDASATSEIVRESIPNFARLLTQPIGSWDEDTIPGAMSDMYRYSLVNSFGFVSPHQTKAGDVVYGSANGVMYRWKPGHHATPMDVGVRASIETTLVTSSGSWIAGGELGTLLMSTDEGRTWRSIRGALPFGVMTDLAQWRDQIIVTVLRGKNVRIYSADEATLDWKLLASHDLQISSFWDIQGVRPQSYLMGNMLVTTLPGRKLAAMDLVSWSIEIRSLPGAIQMFSASRDGVLRCRCAATIAVSPYESNDLGKTWKPSSASRFALLPAFKDSMHGVSYVGQWLAKGGALAYTEDGGKTWVEATKADVYFDNVFFSDDGTQAFAASAFGPRMISSDAGKTWRAAQY